MRKASYIHQVGTYMGKPYIAIVDQNIGSMSVTNDIEDVISEICRQEGIEAEDHIVVYQDSEGTWDGFSTVRDSFIILSQNSKEAALMEYINLLKVDKDSN